MTESRTEGGGHAGSTRRTVARAFDPEELRRRNLVSVGMDLLYLATTGFFAHTFVRGVWPAVIAALPLAAFLYFGWHASKAFFLAQAVTVAVTVAATVTGAVSL